MHGTYLIQMISDQISPYKSQSYNSEQFVNPLKVFQMSAFKSEPLCFQTCEHGFNLPSFGINFQRSFRIIKACNDQQFSVRQFHAADVYVYISDLPTVSENAAFTGFHIPEQNTALHGNTCGIRDILIFPDSDADGDALRSEPAEPSAADELTIRTKRSDTTGSEQSDETAYQFNTFLCIGVAFFPAVRFSEKFPATPLCTTANIRMLIFSFPNSQYVRSVVRIR